MIDDEPFVLKHVDHRDDWIMRQTGDVGCVPVRVWESGVLDLLPDCIDHATVGAAREEGHGAVLMRDVGRWLIPAGDAPLDAGAAPPASSTTSPRCTRRAGAGTTTSASCRSATATRSSVPTRSTCEAALGFPQPVPRIATEGWQRLDDASPELAAALAAAPPGAVGAVRRPGRDAQDLAPRRHEVREPRDAARRAHRLRRLVDHAARVRRSPRSRTRSRSTGPACRTDTTKDGTVEAYRAALERHDVDTAPWFERQLVAVPARRDAAARRGRRRSTRPARELAWWRDHTLDTARELARA